MDHWEYGELFIYYRIQGLNSLNAFDSEQTVLLLFFAYFPLPYRPVSVL